VRLGWIEGTEENLLYINRLSLAVHTQTPRCNMNVLPTKQNRNAEQGRKCLLSGRVTTCFELLLAFTVTRNKKVLPVAIRSRAMRQVTLQSFEEKKT